MLSCGSCTLAKFVCKTVSDSSTQVTIVLALANKNDPICQTAQGGQAKYNSLSLLVAFLR
jgi:hypothetical protein